MEIYGASASLRFRPQGEDVLEDVAAARADVRVVLTNKSRSIMLDVVYKLDELG